MLIYGFIATPAHAWHQHKNAGASKTEALHFASTTDDDAKAVDCKICQHTYSAYGHSDVAFLMPAPIINTVKNPTHPSFSTFEIVIGSTNKGPPTLY